ncbi:MAG: hypothetical protein NFCOHLIN_01462 [Gammaproteobacteria bacterium]|nr:hypothetical protein [Gammaproteobacteria bacterium]
MNPPPRSAASRLRKAVVATAALSAAAIAPVPARAEPVYQVEMIVFHHLRAAVPPHDPTMPPMPRDPSIAPGAIDPGPLPREAMLLNDSVRRLDASGKYRTVLHIGWRQNAAQSQPLRIGDPVGVEESGVRGHAALQVGQQLAFSADLSCRRDGSVAVIRARRSVRIGELHYVDNPLCGLLVQVTRVRESGD